MAATPTAATRTAATRTAAVVTGASRGLGLAIATELHRAGYDVLLTDVDADAAAAATAPLSGWSARLDVRYDQACEAIAERAAQRRGGLAVWVNNAGVLATGPSWTHDAATRRKVMEVNALGGMNGTLAALEVMRRQGNGHIINVVSLAGLVAAPGESVYAASKHAMMAFSIGTLAELRATGEMNVHISCFCPDGIWTPMLHDKVTDAEAAVSFTGTLLTSQRAAERVLHLVEHPRPVLAMPRWRGGLVRVLDAFPRLSVRAANVALAAGRAGQRRQARRMGKGSP
jgi:short-subunit dehydrogenase